jgi:tetratricopeptide (TPR) repeat protein
VDGREVYTEREQDLNKFIVNKRLKISNFVRISGDKHVPTCLINAEDFQNVVSNGITSNEINQKYFSMRTQTLIEKQDSILENIISRRIPITLLNGNVYASLRQKDFDRALGFAKLQALANPQDPNAWDTLGEVNYFIGNKALAGNYYKHSIKLDPDFKAGGEGAWEKSLKEFEKTWKQR